MLLALKLLLLLLIANGAPIVASGLLGKHCAWPVDAGRMTAAGTPLLGPSKTWRGLVAAIVMAALVSYILGIPWAWGATIGALAMLGDLMASFIKRRLGYAPSSHADGLDQIPESLLPLLVLSPVFDLNLLQIVITVTAFYLMSRLLSYVLFRIGIRQTPY